MQRKKLLIFFFNFLFCPQKVAYLWQLGDFFFSAALPTQKKPRTSLFIIFSIQLSLLESFGKRMKF